MYQVPKFLLTSERQSYKVLTALSSGGKVQGENCHLFVWWFSKKVILLRKTDQLLGMKIDS